MRPNEANFQSFQSIAANAELGPLEAALAATQRDSARHSAQTHFANHGQDVYDAPISNSLLQSTARMLPVPGPNSTIDFAQTGNRGRAMAAADHRMRAPATRAQAGRRKEWEVCILEKHLQPMPMILRDRGCDEARFRQDMLRLQQLVKINKKDEFTQFCRQINTDYYKAKGVLWSFERRPYAGWYIVINGCRLENDGPHLHHEWHLDLWKRGQGEEMPMLLRDRGVSDARFDSDMARLVELRRQERDPNCSRKTVERDVDKVSGGCCGFGGPAVHTTVRVTKSVSRDFQQEYMDLCQEVSSDYYFAKGVQWSTDWRPGFGRYVVLDCSRNS